MAAADEQFVEFVQAYSTRLLHAAFLMTGDRLETDVLMGLEAGMAAALTLTGATSEADLAASPVKPHYVLRQLAELIP